MSKQQRIILIVSILATFVSTLDGSIVNVALPAIAEELGGGLVVQQWVVNAYLITLGSLILIAGSLSDLFGRKKILMIGLIGFGIASLLCAVAPTGLTLIIARAIQGVAGALLVPSSLALIMASFSGPAEGKAIGSWTAWTVIAPAIGPIIGGLLVDAGSWRWIFVLNVFPITAAIWMMHTMHLKEKRNKDSSVDIKGALLCAVGLAGVVYALVEQTHFGWDSPMIFLPFAIGIIALMLFLWYERRTKTPMLPLDLFKLRNFSIGNIATIAVYGGLSVGFFLLTIFVQQIGQYPATWAGIALFPTTVLVFSLSSFFGSLAGRYGPRFFMATGPLIIATGYLTMLQVDQSVAYWPQLFPGIMLFGLGLSITVAPLTAAILGSVDTKESGIGSAVNNAVARIASLVGVAALGFVIGPAITVESFHTGVIFTAALLTIGGLISAIGIKNSVGRGLPR